MALLAFGWSWMSRMSWVNWMKAFLPNGWADYGTTGWFDVLENTPDIPDSGFSTWLGQVRSFWSIRPTYLSGNGKEKFQTR
jgi:hypothetical protein